MIPVLKVLVLFLYLYGVFRALFWVAHVVEISEREDWLMWFVIPVGMGGAVFCLTFLLLLVAGL
jgi:hypothetical protein